MKRIRQFILLSLLLSLGASLAAQHDVHLKGEVVEQNSKFNTGHVRFLSGVEIKALGNATTSNPQGLFDLAFADKPVGSTVRVFATKQGYELVNDEEMKKTAVVGRQVPMKVVMCPQGQLFDMQTKYYAIAYDAKMEGYRKQMAILEKEGEEKESLLVQMAKDFNVQRLSADSARALLYTQLQDAQRQAQELADKFVTVNLDDQSETYQSAFRAFMANNVDLAIRIMDNVDLKGRLEANAETIRKCEKVILSQQAILDSALKQMKQDLDQVIASARWHKLQYRLYETDSLYALAMKYAGSDFEISLEYASFLQKQNHFGRAKNIYDDLLQIEIPQKNLDLNAILPHLTVVIQRICYPLFYVSEYSDSSLNNQETMNFCSIGVQRSSEHIKQWRARILTNLGLLLFSLNEMEEARQRLEEALAIYRALGNIKPEVYLPDLASALDNMGIFFKKLNDKPRAMGYYESALEIRRALAIENPDANQPGLAVTLNNYGVLLRTLNLPTEARSLLEEALEIRRKLAIEEPAIYLPKVATTLNNLGSVHDDLHEFLTERALYEEAVEIQRNLVSKNPEVYLPNLVATLNNLGNMHAKMNDYSNARVCFDEALQAYRELSGLNSQVYLPDVAMALNNLGILLDYLDDRAAAKEHHAEALAIRRKLVAKNPKVYLPDLATTLHNFGVLMLKDQDFIAAKSYLLEAFAFRSQCFRDNPRAFGIDAANTAISLARLEYNLILAMNDAGSQIECLRYLSQARKFLGVYGEPIPIVEECFAMIENDEKKLQAINAQLYTTFKNVALLENAVASIKEMHEKVEKQMEIVALWQEIRDSLPRSEEARSGLSNAYGRLARHHLFDQNPAAAEAAARKGLQLALDETWIYTNLALALLYQGKWEEAKEIYLRLKDQPYGDATCRETFQEDLDALENAGITHQDVEKARQLLR
jgi:Tfp pilus assembly protein PilF